ncbi:MAG TPA: AIPR family protein [Spirochaetota bacterium]|nr:AIPR family protein [Spirochaetota bacterium]
MAKAKTPLIEKNIEKFINNNFDKSDRKKDDSKKFEWFVNSMHIWHSSSQSFNSNTKIGKDISLGNSQGGDAFFISVNNYERIYSLKDNIDEIIEHLKKHGKSITFHFIQTKKREKINWDQFLNLIDVPLIIWKGQDFDGAQPILKKVQTFIDDITDENDEVLKKLDHKIEIMFYTNKDNNDIEKLKKDWDSNLNNKKSDLSNYFSQKNIIIDFRGIEFLNEIYERINSNTYSLAINKENVIQVEEKKYLIGYITAKELLNSIAPEVNGIRTLYPDVFKNNIRLYLGRNEINKKIEETLLNEPIKFHFYNNGLTITTKEIKDENSKCFVISPVNIVNGCQTANSIYNISKLDTFDESNVKIPVKIIVAEDKEYENITIRTNTQNGLEAKDLISITNIQKELQDEFNKINFFGKLFYYKRQKSGEDIENTNIDYIIQIDDILRASFSIFLLIPNKVSGYFDQTTLKFVDKIFDERFSKLYVIITALFKIIEDVIDESFSNYSRLKYHILYVFFKFINKDVDIKSFCDYFTDVNDEIDEQSNTDLKLLIDSTYSNLYEIMKDKENFDVIFSYLINKIEVNYPDLVNISSKEQEKILYKPVEKLKRTRALPLFDNFNEIFLENYRSILIEKNKD